MYPQSKLRRLRSEEMFRNLITETRINKSQLICPLFIIPGRNQKIEIKLLEGHFQFSADLAVKKVEALYKIGYRNFIIFGIPECKDDIGSFSYNQRNTTQEAIRLITKEFKDVLIMADLCLCSYTSHGHCGLIKDGNIDNESTLEILAKSATSLCEAGANVVAPSGMMDGAVLAIRRALDDYGFSEKAIMGYSAKYASALYGPFREAADSTPQFGDRRSYQLNPANVLEALREVKADYEEGADMLMIKPAMLYLDVIQQVKKIYNLPLGAYQVSGEYAMMKAAGRAGIANVNNLLLESLISIRRAGADMIFSYACEEIADLI